MKQWPFAMIMILLLVGATGWGAVDATSGLLPVHPQGASVPVSNVAQKARVWVFLSAKCPCSNSHIDKLRQAASEFSSQGFEFIGVHSNQDEEEDLARSYFRSIDLGFPVFRDPGAKVADRFGALKTPHVFVEAPDRTILYEGGVDDSKSASSTTANYLRDALLEIQAGKEVSRRRTRSLGCVISRRSKS